MKKSIILAETAGFCFGVNRAIELVNSLLDEGKKVCTLGPIIHNEQVVEDLERKGIRVIHSREELSSTSTPNRSSERTSTSETVS